MQDYEFSGYKKLQDELRAEALRATQARAQAMVQVFGEKLGRVLEITDGAEPPRMYKNMEMRTMAAMADDTAPSITVDFQKMQYQVHVSAIFEIQ